MSEWQPIDTAPTDGTNVLLFDAPEKQCVVGYYAIDREKWMIAVLPDEWEDDRFGYAIKQPTLWQAIPALPEVAK